MQGFARTSFWSRFLDLKKRAQDCRILVKPPLKRCARFVLSVSAHAVRATALSMFIVFRLETQDEERFGGHWSAILRLKPVCAQ